MARPDGEAGRVKPPCGPPVGAGPERRGFLERERSRGAAQRRGKNSVARVVAGSRSHRAIRRAKGMVPFQPLTVGGAVGADQPSRPWRFGKPAAPASARSRPTQRPDGNRLLRRGVRPTVLAGVMRLGETSGRETRSSSHAPWPCSVSPECIGVQMAVEPPATAARFLMRAGSGRWRRPGVAAVPPCLGCQIAALAR